MFSFGVIARFRVNTRFIDAHMDYKERSIILSGEISDSDLSSDTGSTFVFDFNLKYFDR